MVTDSLEIAHDDDHSGPLAELVTVRDWLRYAVSRFNQAALFFGHGTDNAFDEAVYLILHTLALPLDRLEPFLDACITSEERPALLDIIERRITKRLPAAYLTHESWLGGYRFYVDDRVIVPRSYFAELLLEDGLMPWLSESSGVERALDMCTGSGCLAIIMADVFPDAQIVAADISPDALAVAEKNVDDYALSDRVALVQTDLFQNLSGQKFDLIICNPPYVTDESMSNLPPEYRHEPSLALGAGEKGLDVVNVLIEQAAQYLTPHGLLLVEVGHNRALVEAAYPTLPVVWLATSHSEDKIFMLRHSDLIQAS